MAPIIYPAPVREQFRLSGTGALTLTEAQRRAKSLTVVIEKVKQGSAPEYYNFRPPEPRSFWGYIQLVQRDFIVQETQLEYRRHRLIHWDRVDLQYLIELRCLIKALGALMICGFNTVLAETNDGIPVDPDEFGPNVDDCLPDWQIARDRSDQIQEDSITAIWYSFEPGFSGYITLTMQDYAKPCDDGTGGGSQAQPEANAPAAGESGPNSVDGGGQRPGSAPPVNRSSDPTADIPSPPTDVPGGPPSPVGGGARVRVRVQGQVINGRNLGCQVLDPIDDLLLIEGEYNTDLSNWTITLDGGLNPGGCVGATTGYTVRYQGNAVGGAGPAGFYDAPSVVSVQLA